MKLMRYYLNLVCAFFKLVTAARSHRMHPFPDLKRRFDAGEDPNDPQAGQNPFSGHGGGGFPGGHPFAQFFQGGGQGGGFKFHYSGF